MQKENWARETDSLLELHQYKLRYYAERRTWTMRRDIVLTRLQQAAASHTTALNLCVVGIGIKVLAEAAVEAKFSTDNITDTINRIQGRIDGVTKRIARVKRFRFPEFRGRRDFARI